MGDVIIELFPNHAPKTVANFVELATGKREWADPITGEKTTKNLYDGTIFHRVIANFMIQGGDPLGNGTGGPGYQFADEFHGELAFDRPYILAMANSGPGTNGSQFFITVAETAWLNRKHTIFGEVKDEVLLPCAELVRCGRHDVEAHHQGEASKEGQARVLQPRDEAGRGGVREEDGDWQHCAEDLEKLAAE